MSTDADTNPEGTKQKKGFCHGSWTVPVTSAVLGATFLVIYLAHDDTAMAVSGLALMLAYAAVLVFGSRRSEAVSLLRGESPDERARSIEQRAAALTLHVLAVVLVGGYIVSLARNTGETTWAGLCAVLGGTYLLSTIVLTRRG